MKEFTDAETFDTLDFDERAERMRNAGRQRLAQITDGGETKVASHAGSDLTMVDGLGGATFRRYAPTK